PLVNPTSLYPPVVGPPASTARGMTGVSSIPLMAGTPSLPVVNATTMSPLASGCVLKSRTTAFASPTPASMLNSVSTRTPLMSTLNRRSPTLSNSAKCNRTLYLRFGSISGNEYVQLPRRCDWYTAAGAASGTPEVSMVEPVVAAVQLLPDQYAS